MPRDYKKLQVFRRADDLVVAVYEATKAYPKSELFGLASQTRHATVLMPANIVEGSARHTEKEVLNFLNIAYGSLAKVGYFIDLSLRLGSLSLERHAGLKGLQEETSCMLNGLMRSLRKS